LIYLKITIPVQRDLLKEKSANGPVFLLHEKRVSRVVVVASKAASNNGQAAGNSKGRVVVVHLNGQAAVHKARVAGHIQVVDKTGHIRVVGVEWVVPIIAYQPAAVKTR
jgi:phosphohistidine swiveling domain-containing protein